MLVYLQRRRPLVGASRLKDAHADPSNLGHISHKFLNQQNIHEVLRSLISSALPGRLGHPVKFLRKLVVQG